MKYLPPLILTERMWAPIEDTINEIFERTIFAPLRDALKTAGIEIQNAKPGIEQALLEGLIWYADGRVYGKFNSTISQELKGMGAVFDKRSESWKFPGALPFRFQMAVAAADARAQKAINAVVHTLDGIQLDDDRTPEQLREEYGTAAWRINEDFVAATASVAVAPEFTPVARAAIAKEWATNLDLYIKNWSSESILELREKVEANTMRGQRSGNLVKMIQEMQGVSRTKAKFLARQETSLLMSKMREERYKDIGVERYKWNGANDEREREDHKLLNNKIFSWSSPPITNRQTGARNHPGEDFNCLPGNSRVNVLNGVEKCFRRWYRGKLTQIITDSGRIIRATPNHPVLTLRGWKPIGLLDNSDYIINIPQKLFNGFEGNSNQGKATIRQIFESLRKTNFLFTAAGKRENFHGDGSASNINIIDSSRTLCVNRQIYSQQLLYQFPFTFTEFFATRISSLFEHLCSFGWWYSFCGFMRFCSQFLPIFKRKSAHPNAVRFGDTANGDVIFKQPTANNNSLKAGSFRDGKFTFTGEISIDDGFYIKLQSIMGATLDRVVSLRNAYFVGHVYNLQTDLGYYTTTDAVVSNCRCIAIPILD